MIYTELKPEFVIETLAKGTEVVLCDFSSMKLLACSDLTIGGINSYISKEGVKFFKGVNNDPA